MAMTSSSPLPTKSWVSTQCPLSSSSFPKPHQSSFSHLPANPRPGSLHPLTAIHGADKAPLKAAPPLAASTASATPAATPTKWNLESWKTKKAVQIPEYPDREELEAVLKTLDSFPPIVFAGEARSLEERLGEAAMGNAFLLQGGDCAESFKEFNANNIRDTFRILLQMGVVLMFGGQVPVIKVGRMAGQFAKPRSDSFEEKNGVKLPSYRGDNVNGDAFDLKSRTPDPQRLIRAYCQSAATLNLLRAFATGGYAAMQRVTQWNLDFTEHSEQGDRYRELAHRVDEALGFMAAAGLTLEHPIMTTTEFWTSHECLLLPYEQSLTRQDSTSGLYYDCSAHMIWVGERTRQLDGAHVEFLRGVANPLGIKVSDKMDPTQLVKLIEILNPHNKPGRITIITRMGAENMRVKLPHLIRGVRRAGQIVTWVSDPMHGNTNKNRSSRSDWARYSASSGPKSGALGLPSPTKSAGNVSPVSPISPGSDTTVSAVSVASGVVRPVPRRAYTPVSDIPPLTPTTQTALVRRASISSAPDLDPIARTKGSRGFDESRGAKRLAITATAWVDGALPDHKEEPEPKAEAPVEPNLRTVPLPTATPTPPRPLQRSNSLNESQPRPFKYTNPYAQIRENDEPTTGVDTTPRQHMRRASSDKAVQRTRDLPAASCLVRVPLRCR